MTQTDLKPSIDTIVSRARAEKAPGDIIAALPYASLLGMTATYEADTDKLLLCLPGSKSNIGNPTLPALHGGAIGGFMEISAGIHLLMTMDTLEVPRVVDFSIDFVRAGRLEDTWASCDVVRQGRKLVNVAIQAWQQDRESPIATARAHFLID